MEENKDVPRKEEDNTAMMVENPDSSVPTSSEPDRGGTAGKALPGSSLPCVSDCGAVGEQFIQLAKSAKGAAAAQLIKEALEAPGLYVFAELLHMPNIKELASHAEHSGHYRLLEMFAYGIYDDYLQNKSSLPPLSPAMLTKLRHLTLVTLASNQKTLPLEILVNKLSLNTRRELEDLIIEAIYADVLHGKLDQKNGVLEVDYALGRDIKPENLPQIAATLKAWCETCTGMLTTLEGLAVRANKEKESSIRRAQSIEQEVSKIKNTSKRQGPSGEDDCTQTDNIREVEKMLQRIKKGSGSQASTSGSSKSSSSSSSKFWAKS